MRSIQRYIQLTSAALTLLAGIALLVGSIVSINHETEEVFDASLAQSAQLIQTLLPIALLSDTQDQSLTKPAGDIPLQMEEERAEALATLLSTTAVPVHHYASKLAFIIHDTEGKPLLRSSVQFHLPVPESAGIQRQLASAIEWRSYSLFDQRQQVWVTTAQQLSVIEELGVEVLENVLPPMLLIATALLLAISWAVKRGLKPLREVSNELNQRQANDLSAIDSSHMPRELQTPLKALNAMFLRVEAGLQRERRFTDDAAHELRTPLAAMRIYLEQLPAEQDSTQALRQGVTRMERLVGQLLQLARLDPQQHQSISLETFDLSLTSAEVVAELYPQAQSRQMQIELVGDSPCLVKGQQTLLQILLRNLLENAIRYSNPEDCLQVYLRKSQQGVELEVIDHGKGLSDEEKGRVFQRFYRSHKADGMGAGLGLSIVATVIELHHGRCHLLDTAGGGLTVKIEIPDP
ncbi:ATP-binding protein [Motiliproteus sp. MSK22-1]|uniref:ATP-binding protein n=1 Tax=Motiliproteus sp. MSK22-1 TaxID=1897630 RepID=UPI000975B5A8|nr:ATP-binding protein [Motiliproteus sp. MSK22-1]OMH28023.1 hypothetical protein BGP75_21885 [Motiliproteus sp. MSK22-1]